MKKLAITITAVLAVVGLAACTGSSTPSAIQKDQAAAKQQLASLQTNQPVPVFTYSQLRQTLIDVETAQAQTTQTTSFFFNQGVQDPTDSCPSIGFPVPSTYQLTNPQQVLRDTGSGNGGNVTIPQIEANGVYTDQSSGTYVLCVDAKGQAYANYWEGFVKTVAAPAKWNAASHQVELLGPPSFKFTVKGK